MVTKIQQTGAELIAAERRRQIEEEGWSPEHDDAHQSGSIALAAACYALPEYWRKEVGTRGAWGVIKLNAVQLLWPWDRMWWKPTPEDRVRELVKAGALIAAEIDRLQRSTPTTAHHE